MRRSPKERFPVVPVGLVKDPCIDEGDYYKALCTPKYVTQYELRKIVLIKNEITKFLGESDG